MSSARDFICLVCPNGCHLTATILDAQSIEISGNRCDKGIAFARSVLDSETVRPSRLVAGEKRPVYSKEALQEIGLLWGIRVRAIKPGISLSGSPERTLFRVVVEDEQGELFILEQIQQSSYHAKMRLIRSLDFLASQGQPKVVPYRPAVDGQYIRRYVDALWQVIPFTPGVPLDRTTYLYDAWRGDVLAEFLIRLKKTSFNMPSPTDTQVFSLEHYIYNLLRRIEDREPRIFPTVRGVVSLLEKDFFKTYKTLPVSFCHGDYHPMNIIWGRADIEAVIDWEFCGIKPEMYDAANMVGCLGIEHPSALVNDLVIRFLQGLRTAGIYADKSWQVFFDFVIAMRFAWLSEWLRKDDQEMIALELDYMTLLIENKDEILKAWA